MGVLSGKDLLSSKYTTAIIINADNRAFFVPIKYVIGDYFLAMIERQIYCFRLEGIRQLTYRHTLVKSFRMLIYTTDHYLPISPSDIKLLEETLKHNTLPKMNHMLFSILKLLGKKEKHESKEAVEHDLLELVEKIGRHENEFPNEAQSIKNFIEQLAPKKIVTPLKKLTEFLESDLLATDPKFLGDVVTQHLRTDDEQKKMANKPITGKFPLLKMMLILMIIGAVIGIGYYVYSSGMLSNVANPLGNFSGPSASAPATANDIMTKYPTPEALKAAIDRGEVNYNTLPASVKKMVDQVKLPTIKATP